MLNDFILTVSTRANIPAPTPQWDGPGLSGLIIVVGWVMAIVLVLCVLGGLLSAAAIGLGRALQNGQVQDAGLKGLMGCGIGTVVCAIIVVVLNWIFGIF